MAHYLAFETAWTEALQALGRIERPQAEQALARLSGFSPDWAQLARDTARDGVVVPSLVRQLREGVEVPAALHGGATSQDVVDTALALTLRRVSDVLEMRVRNLLACLDALETRFGDCQIMGRTRMQAAQPLQIRDRLRIWAAPLGAQLHRLGPRRAGVERLQFGGAVGNRAELGADASEMAQRLATQLGLDAPKTAWHSDRTAIADYANWLVGTAGAVGKMGMDLCLMAQQGDGEIRLRMAGRSSAMAHKQNPTGAELCVALARFAVGLNTTIQNAIVHEQERSGMAWMSEWMALPPLTIACACACRTARDFLETIETLGREV